MADGDPSEAAWRAAIGTVLKGAGFDTLVARTLDGMEIQPLYPAAEASPNMPWRDTGRPVAVFGRVDHPDAAEAATLASLDLEGGAGGLVLTGPGSVSAFGFGLASDQFGAALEGLARPACALRLDAPWSDHARAVTAVLRSITRHGTNVDSFEIDLGGDPLAPDAAERVRGWRERGLTGPLLRADGRFAAFAGASEAEELAAVLAAGVAGFRALEPLGLKTAQGALSFTLPADTDQVLTVAKLRALRLLWARVETACGLAPKPISLHVETAWRMMARQDPHTNILRTAIAAASALFGGAGSLTVLPSTSALGLPDAFARRLARNTVLVLRDEAHLGRVADPAAGAGAFEAVTEALAEKAWALFQDLERQGGLLAATASGWWPKTLADSRTKREAALRDGTAVRVGVTRFGNANGARPPVLMPAPATVSPPSPWREAEALETMER